MKRVIFKKWLYVAFGGFFGTLLRVLILTIHHSVTIRVFAWHFLVINLIGALVTGYLYNGLKKKLSIEAQAGLFIGFLGSFTTFSDLILVTNELLSSHKIFWGITYVLGTLIGGVLLFYLGSLGARAKN